MSAQWNPVASKLQPPILPGRTLDRPHLAGALAEATRRRLVVISADAGFGKTTLAARFIPSAPYPVVWYRLDSFDSDPATFTAYLLVAVRIHLPRSAYSAARQSLSVITDWSAAARVLATALSRLRQDVILILDDSHLLNSPTLERGLTRLIEDLPPRAHLVLLGRVRPNLPLARWLASGQAREFGPEDLRLSAAELRELLIDLHELPLTEATLHLVEAKTEGWPAAVGLALHAAVSRGPAAAAQALAALSGTSREIYEYMAQEAFLQQEPQIQQFLLATAPLSRFTVPMAEALLEIADGRRILDQIERSHLFVVQLDRDRRWYRYHHLFSEFLVRVAMEREPDRLRLIHLRAGKQWEDQGELEEAMRHYLDAEAFDDAARLLAASGVDLIGQGRFETIRRLMDAIPQIQWRLFPRLHLIRGMAEVASGDVSAAWYALDEARTLLRTTGDVEGEAYALRWLGYLAIWGGGLDHLRALLEEVQPRLREFSNLARARVLEVTARIEEAAGHLSVAETAFPLVLESARASGDEYTELGATWHYANFLRLTARFDQARLLLGHSIATAHSRRWTHDEAHYRVDLAFTLMAEGRLEEAQIEIAGTAALAAGVPCRVLDTHLILARAQLASQRRAYELAETLLRQLLEGAESRHIYAVDLMRAQIELSLVLARTKPPETSQEAKIWADRALEVARRLGPFHLANAQLASGVAAHDAARCRQAAAIFAELGLAHWEALALLRAFELDGSNFDADAQKRLRDLLAEQPEGGWKFLVGLVDHATLRRLAGDARFAAKIDAVAPQIHEGPALTVQCLGRFELRRDGTHVSPQAWPRAAPRRLFQFLLVQNRPVHREEIVEALWPDLEPKNASNQLRVALSQLRRILDPGRSPRALSPVLVTTGPTVMLVKDRLDVDVDRFLRALSRSAAVSGPDRRNALEEAITLYRGDLFEDSPYEDWALTLRDSLARRYTDALAALAEDDEAVGRWEAASARWAAVIARQPEAEHAYRGLIRCFLAMGRAGDAARAFQQCQQALAALGVAPALDTLKLLEVPRHPGA